MVAVLEPVLVQVSVDFPAVLLLILLSISLLRWRLFLAMIFLFV